MKILKPGLDYRLTFVEFVNKTSFAKHVDNLRLVDEEDIEAERKDFMNKTASLSKDEMGRLLRSMGIAMKEFDLKALIDAFDADGGEGSWRMIIVRMMMVVSADRSHYWSHHHQYHQHTMILIVAHLSITFSARLSSSDGRVTLSEFLDFTGPKRDRKGM